MHEIFIFQLITNFKHLFLDLICSTIAEYLLNSSESVALIIEFTNTDEIYEEFKNNNDILRIIPMFSDSVP